MASDIEQDNFFLGYTKCQGDTVDVGDADGMKSFKFSAERVQSKGRQKGIGFEMSQRIGEWLFEFRVGSRNLFDYADQNGRSSATHPSGIETQFAVPSAPSHGALALLSHLSTTGEFVRFTTCDRAPDNSSELIFGMSHRPVLAVRTCTGPRFRALSTAENPRR